MTKRAIIYIRVSSDEQAVNGTSPDVQRDACLMMASQMGFQVADIVPDLGVSGVRYSSRPGIQKALKYIEAGEAEVLLATKVDRVGRSAAVILDIASRVRKAGGELVTQDARFDATPMGLFTLTMFAGMAELERNNIRERTKSGAVRRAQEGVQPQRSRSPFGLHVITKADKERGLYPDDAAGSYVLTAAAPVVAEMFSRYAGGQSLREVCRWLNDTGVQTQFGGEYWRPSQLKKVLVNPAYQGTATYGKTARWSEEIAEKTVIHLAFRTDHLSITCPAIVSEETFAAVQERLGSARAVFGGNPERRHLLGGLLRCPLCGRGMTGTKRQKRTHGGRCVQQVHTYACPDSRASRNAGGRVCNRKAYDGAKVEPVVLRGVRDAARAPELFETAMSVYRRGEAAGYDPAAHGRLETALRALGAKEKATVEAQVQGVMAGADPTIYAAAFGRIAEERASLTAQIRAAEGQKAQAVAPAQDDAARLMAQALADVDEVLTSGFLTDGEKHDVLARVVESIVPEQVGGEEGYRVSLRPMPGKSAETVHRTSMLCPPAAATSRARLTCSCPLTSQKSCSSPPTCWRSVSGSAVTGVPASTSSSRTTTSASVRTPKTLTSPTIAASWAFASGTTKKGRLSDRALTAIGRTPATGLTAPSKANSPTNNPSAILSLLT